MVNLPFPHVWKTMQSLDGIQHIRRRPKNSVWRSGKTGSKRAASTSWTPRQCRKSTVVCEYAISRFNALLKAGMMQTFRHTTALGMQMHSSHSCASANKNTNQLNTTRAITALPEQVAILDPCPVQGRVGQKHALESDEYFFLLQRVRVCGIKLS